jgi:hypothetical protein
VQIRRVRILTPMAAAVLLSGALEAQVPATPRELGMGGAHLAVARGHGAVFLNPANLGLSDAPAWSFAFPQVAGGGTITGPTARDIPALLDFRDEEPFRQEELLSLIPAGGLEGDLQMRAPLATLSIGGFGLGVAFSAAGSHVVSRSLTELFLRGYEEGRTSYAVENTGGRRSTYWEFAAGYGARIHGVSVGGAGRYIRGGTLSRTRLFEPRIDVEASTLEVDYYGVSAVGGGGFALDVGAAYQPLPTVTLGAAISGLLGRMTWSEDLQVRSLTLDRDLIENATAIDIRNRYHHSVEPLDPAAVPLAVYATAEGLYDQAYLPTVARFGAAWHPLRGTHLAADLHARVTGGSMGDAWDRRLAIGAEQSFWLLKVRGGLAAGNDGGSLLSGGLSIGPLDMGVGRYRHSRVDGVGRSGFLATLGLAVEQPRW